MSSHSPCSGSTLKARVDPSSVLGQSSSFVERPPTSSVVSRPDFLPQHQSQPQVQPQVQVQVPVIAQPQPQAQPQPPPQNSRRDHLANIDNFADFDGAAFDSLPPGNPSCFSLITNISILFQIKLNLNQ